MSAESYTLHNNFVDNKAFINPSISFNKSSHQTLPYFKEENMSFIPTVVHQETVLEKPLDVALGLSVDIIREGIYIEQLLSPLAKGIICGSIAGISTALGYFAIPAVVITPLCLLAAGDVVAYVADHLVNDTFLSDYSYFDLT